MLTIISNCFSFSFILQLFAYCLSQLWWLFLRWFTFTELFVFFLVLLFLSWILSFLPISLQTTVLSLWFILEPKALRKRNKNDPNVLGNSQLKSVSTVHKNPYWGQKFHISISLCRHLSYIFFPQHLLENIIPYSIVLSFLLFCLTSFMRDIAVALEYFFSITNEWCLSFTWGEYIVG